MTPSKKNIFIGFGLVFLCMAFWSACNNQPTGGGTGVEGVSGTLVDPSGSPVEGAWVKLYPVAVLAKTIPTSGTLIKRSNHIESPLDSVQSGPSGHFKFEGVTEGPYTLVASQVKNSKTYALLLTNLDISGSLNLGSHTLQVSGSVKTEVKSDGVPLAGVECVLPGTPFGALTDSTGTCFIEGVPPGTFNIAITDSIWTLTLRESISVQSGIQIIGGLFDLMSTELFGGVPVLSRPSLLTPVNGAEAASNDTVRWTAVLGATHYQLQISNSDDSAFTSPLIDTSLIPTWTTLRGLTPESSYRWRVRVGSVYGSGPWSSQGFFTVGASPVQANHFGVTTSTVALWTFDSVDSLGRYPDFSGNNRHLAAPLTATSTTSTFGQAVTFSATDYPSVSDDNSFVTAGTPVLTYEARIWLDAYPSESLWTGAATVMGQYAGLRMLISYDGRISVDGQTGENGTWAWYGPVTDTGVMPVNQWVDVAVAADGPGGQLFLYVNGSAVQTYNDIEKGPLMRQLTTTQFPFAIANDGHDGQAFPGKIDEIRISDSLVLGPGFVPILTSLPDRL